jgi:nicotinate phosphoribosyltransferase
MIINSLLQTDLYKFTMMQAILHNCPQAQVEYAFKCRNKVDLRPYAEEIRQEINAYCELRLTDAEATYLSGIRFLKPDFVQFLKMLKLDPANVIIDASGSELTIRIKGLWLYTILFEVPILAIVNEVYFKYAQDADELLKSGKGRLVAKVELLKKTIETTREVAVHYSNDDVNINPFLLTDFGTRRRYSAAWQEYVVKYLKENLPGVFIGTSNVYLAMKYGIKPIGTMAHEWLQASQAFVRLIDSQKHALDTWSREYRGDLGIALSDILGIDCFLRDFDMYFAKLFDGVRHDSGDPYDWTRKVIAHYKSMNIDPKTKIAVYSDGLDVPKALALWKEFGTKIKTSFGIGTNLTNDFDGLVPLQVVIKMTRCNGQPVAKISDSSGKTMCEDQKYVEYLKSVFGIGA